MKKRSFELIFLSLFHSHIRHSAIDAQVSKLFHPPSSRRSWNRSAIEILPTVKTEEHFWNFVLLPQCSWWQQYWNNCHVRLGKYNCLAKMPKWHTRALMNSCCFELAIGKKIRVCRAFHAKCLWGRACIPFCKAGKSEGSKVCEAQIKILKAKNSLSLSRRSPSLEVQNFSLRSKTREHTQECMRWRVGHLYSSQHLQLIIIGMGHGVRFFCIIKHCKTLLKLHKYLSCSCACCFCRFSLPRNLVVARIWWNLNNDQLSSSFGFLL